jgi:hypothetical protein
MRGAAAVISSGVEKVCWLIMLLKLPAFSTPLEMTTNAQLVCLTQTNTTKLLFIFAVLIRCDRRNKNQCNTDKSKRQQGSRTRPVHHFK